MNDSRSCRFPRLYTIHSQKGGVGKTAIALAIAGLAAFGLDKKTLIIDADMTGTSLADAEPPSEGISRIKNARLLIKDDDKKKYFNDLVFSIPPHFTKYTPLHDGDAKNTAKEALAPFLWELSETNGMIYVMPGDSSPRKVQAAVPFLSQEGQVHFFRHRLEKIVATSILLGFEVVIVDHSPGMYGITKSSLAIVLDQLCHHEPFPIEEDLDPREEFPSRLDSLIGAACSDYEKETGGLISGQSIMVTSQDAVDFRAILPSIYFCIKQHVTACKKANRSRLPRVDIFEALKRITNEPGNDFIKAGWFAIDVAFNKFQRERERAVDPYLIIPALFEAIGADEQTGLHVRGKEGVQREMGEKGMLAKYLEGRLKSYGAVVGEYLGGFDLSNIIPKIKNMKEKGTHEWNSDEDKWKDWLKFVADLTGLKLP